MYFEVSFFVLTVLALVRIHSLQNFSSRCVQYCAGRVVHFVVKDYSNSRRGLEPRIHGVFPFVFSSTFVPQCRSPSNHLLVSRRRVRWLCKRPTDANICPPMACSTCFEVVLLID